MKSIKLKKIFDKYILSVLIAIFMVTVHNFVLSITKLAVSGNHAAPVYSKVVDSVSAAYNSATEIDSAPVIDNKTKAISSGYKATIARTASVTTSATTTPVSGNYISINGRAIRLEYKQPAGSTLIVPGNHAAYYRNFIYGHNTSSVFGYLNRISVGETITVSINGEARTYRVAAKERKAIGDISMASLIYNKSYAHILMTCVGDGSTHRDIIYLN